MSIQKHYYGYKILVTMALLMLPMSLIMNTASVFTPPAPRS